MAAIDKVPLDQFAGCGGDDNKPCIQKTARPRGTICEYHYHKARRLKLKEKKNG